MEKPTKVRKVSVVSIESVKMQSEKLAKHWENVDIKDRFNYVTILFLLMGLMHFLPYSFFTTANAYWMEKFRNVSLNDSQDATKRTVLQSHFFSGTSMTNTIANSVFVVISTFLGHKIKARTRVLITVSSMTICFCLITLFVEVNTDSWQVPFFCVIIGILAIINAVDATLQMAVLVILAKFPTYYMKVYLFGEGCASIFNATLQILTLAVGTSITTSALIYFVLGTAMMGGTLAMYYFSKYNKYYMYFVEHSEEDLTRNMLSFSEFKSVLRSIWPAIFLYFLHDLGKLPQSPVTALVVSEDHGNGHDWNDIYFVPVVTYLFGDICTLLGRTACSMSKPRISFLIQALTFMRIIVYTPLLLFCNAQPRKHLPVLLGHDWEYVLVVGTLYFTNGYLINVVFLSINQLMVPEKVADGYLVLMTAICTIGALFSPLSTFSVDLL